MKTFLAFTLLLIGVRFSGSLPAQTFTVQKYSIGGEGGTDYLTAEPGTGRVFVSRGSHVMVIDGNAGKVLGDIPETPNTHGIALAAKYNHGFTTNRGDSTLTMFDLTTLVPIRKIKIPAGGQDGIMYDDFTDRIILTNHSNPGTATAVDPNAGVITGEAQLDDNSPEGAASDGKGKLFVNLERKNAIQVVDAKTMKAIGMWPLDSCDGPTGIAYRSDLRQDIHRLRQNVGCGECRNGKDRGDDSKRRGRRCTRLGPDREAHLYSCRTRQHGDDRS